MSIEFSSGDIIAIAVAILSSITSIVTVFLQSKQKMKEEFYIKQKEIQGNVYAKLTEIMPSKKGSGNYVDKLNGVIVYCLLSFPYLTENMWNIVTDIINECSPQKETPDGKFVADKIQAFTEELHKEFRMYK